MSHDATMHTPPPPVVTSCGRRERRDAAENRQRILKAAAQLFVERGVEAVTMDEVALAAGVGKGTLYRRYPDKGQLVMALMDVCVQNLKDEIAARLDPERVGAEPSLNLLDAVLTHLVAWTEQHTVWLGVLSDQAAGARRGALHCGPLYKWMHTVVVDLLQQAVARGEAEPMDAVYTADAFLASLDVNLYLFQRHERGYSIEQITTGLSRLVSGLRFASAPA